MPIKVTCPNSECRRRLKLRDNLAGKKIRCPDCGNTFHVPGEDETPDELLGKTIAHYQIISRIGEGGMAVVYRARNLRLNKIVALKILPPAVQEKDPAFVKHFVREAQSTAQLEHPNVVTVHYVGSESNYHFIEMEYVDGKTLRDLLRDPDNISIAQAARITIEAAKALDAAHEKGIIHRDVKPDNIMLTTDGKVKVADFGLATLGDEGAERVLQGKVLGTPYYMSPEHCRGKETDARSDIYSLGATFFHMLTGEPPFHGERPETVVRMHVKAAVPSPQAFVEDVPDDLEDIVTTMMAKDPDDRYQSCEDLIEDLELAASNLSPPEDTGKIVGGKKGDDNDVDVVEPAPAFPVANVIAGIVAVLLVAAIAVAVFILTSPKQPKRSSAQPPTKGPKAVQEDKKPTQEKSPSRQKVEAEPKAVPTETKETPPKADTAATEAPEAKPEEQAVPASSLPAKGPEQPKTAELPPTKELDLNAYAKALEEIDRLVDERHHDKAIAKADELAGSMPAAAEHLKIKKAHLLLLKMQWSDLLKRDFTGTLGIAMKDISSKYGYAGALADVTESGIIGAKGAVRTEIRWDRLGKEDVVKLMELCTPPSKGDAALALAVLCVEGTEKRFDDADRYLGMAKGLGVDVGALTAEVGFLRTLVPVSPPAAETAKKEKEPPPSPDEKKKAPSKDEKDKAEKKPTADDLRKTFKGSIRYPFSSASRLVQMKVKIPSNPRFERGRTGRAMALSDRKQSVEVPFPRPVPKEAGMIEFWINAYGDKASIAIASGNGPPPPGGGAQGRPQQNIVFSIMIGENVRVAFPKSDKGRSAALQSENECPWDKWVQVSLAWDAGGVLLFIDGELAAQSKGSGLSGDLHSLTFQNHAARAGAKEGQKTTLLLDELSVYAGKKE